MDENPSLVTPQASEAPTIFPTDIDSLKSEDKTTAEPFSSERSESKEEKLFDSGSAFSPPPTDRPDFEAGDAEHPLAVTQVYSSYGLEYIIMLTSLAVAAIGLGSLLDAVIDLATSKSASLVGTLLNPYAEAALIVSFPVFALLFLRLEAREESDSTLRADASRRRGIQITLILSFLIFISQLIGYIGGLLSSSSDSYQGAVSLLSTAPSGGSAGVQLLHALVGLTISGAIFGYYWLKLHKKSGAE